MKHSYKKKNTQICKKYFHKMKLEMKIRDRESIDINSSIPINYLPIRLYIIIT